MKNWSPNQSAKPWKLLREYEHEIAALKAEIFEMKNSQTFISREYDDLKIQHNKMVKENAKQVEEITTSKAEAADIKSEGIKEVQKVDGLEQYG